jgi:hypothetical protein
MPELHSPTEDVRDKVIDRIQLLLQQAPVPPPPVPVDPMTGMPLGPPPPAQPSINYEPYVDDPAIHAELVKEWLNSPPGRKANDPSDPQKSAGYANVVAYGLQCATKAMPQAAPPAPPPPPKISVSLKGEDIGPQGVAQMLGMPNLPIPPPPPMGTPPEPRPGAPGGQGGPPQAEPPLPGGPLNPQVGNMPSPIVNGQPVAANARGGAGALPPVEMLQ